MTMDYLPHILAGVASFAAATLWTLWKIAQHEAEKLSDQLTKAAELDKLHRATIAEREAEIVRLKGIVKNREDAKDAVMAKGNQWYAELQVAKATLARVAFFRNEKEQLVRPDGKGADSKKSRQRAKKKAEPKTETPTKPLTRAEACLAILHEAKDAGFEWAESAIGQISFDRCNESTIDYSIGGGLLRAVYLFKMWEDTKEGFDYWAGIAHSDAVRNFKPKTKWPA